MKLCREIADFSPLAVAKTIFMGKNAVKLIINELEKVMCGTDVNTI